MKRRKPAAAPAAPTDTPKPAGASPADPPKIELTAREKAIVEKTMAKGAVLAPRMKVVDGKDGPRMVSAHANDLIGQLLLMDELATADIDFYNGLMSQLANVGAQGRKIDEGALNFMLAVVKGIKPKDQVESMLAAQMAGVHMATMRMMRRLTNAETIPQQDSAERALNKLARTFATQMEALKRYRTGGEQKVTVQHVSVAEGGQAIVGNVTQAPRENAAEQVTKTAPQLTDAKQAPMTILGTEQDEGKPEPVAIPQKRAKSDGQSSA